MTSDNQVSKIVDIYDPSDGGHWSIDSLSAPRAFLGSINAATVDGKAYFINGAKLNLNTLNWEWIQDSEIIDIFHPEEGWRTQTDLGWRVNHAVVSIENDSISQLLIAGGNPCTSTVDIISKIEQADFQSQEVDYAIFPNPANDELNINAAFKNKTKGTLSLLAVQGHTTYQYDFNSSIIDHKIDLSAFAPGLYLIEIRTENGRMVDKVMVVE